MYESIYGVEMVPIEVSNNKNGSRNSYFPTTGRHRAFTGSKKVHHMVIPLTPNILYGQTIMTGFLKKYQAPGAYRLAEATPGCTW